MKTIFGLSKIKNRLPPTAATIGIFDGLHLGHQSILKKVVKQAKAFEIKSLCVTFWPSPKGALVLYSLKHRLRLIAEMGIDICLVVNFSKAFSKMKAGDFIRGILIRKLNIKEIIIGKNFRFGSSKSGDINLLIKYSKIYGFKVKILDLIKEHRMIISSSHIRDLIAQGALRQAAKLLGRPVAVYGTVIRGKKLGRYLGTPTANINPHHEVLPPPGIYAVNAYLRNNIFPSICYIGSRPTLKLNQIVVEVHLFNFKRNIYGKDIYIEFLKLIRKEKKFNTLLALKNQIKADFHLVRTFFGLFDPTTHCK